MFADAVTSQTISRKCVAVKQEKFQKWSSFAWTCSTYKQIVNIFLHKSDGDTNDDDDDDTATATAAHTFRVRLFTPAVSIKIDACSKCVFGCRRKKKKKKESECRCLDSGRANVYIIHKLNYLFGCGRFESRSYLIHVCHLDISWWARQRKTSESHWKMKFPAFRTIHGNSYSRKRLHVAIR